MLGRPLCCCYSAQCSQAAYAASSHAAYHAPRLPVTDLLLGCHIEQELPQRRHAAPPDVHTLVAQRLGQHLKHACGGRAGYTSDLQKISAGPTCCTSVDGSVTALQKLALAACSLTVVCKWQATSAAW